MILICLLDLETRSVKSVKTLNCKEGEQVYKAKATRLHNLFQKNYYYPRKVKKTIYYAIVNLLAEVTLALFQSEVEECVAGGPNQPAATDQSQELKVFQVLKQEP